MLRNRDPNRKFAGLHFEDPWNEWVKGFKRREEATKDATQLSNEVYNYRHDLFPVRSVPVESHPGYVTHSQNFFRIKTRDNKLSQALTDYFTDEHSYRDDSISYGNAHDLGGFFEFVFHGLLVDGVSIYAIEWGEKTLGTKKYILPLTLLYVNPATVNFNDSSKITIQRFSLVSRLMNDYFEYQNNKFEADELIVFKHPTLYPTSPVGQALKYIKNLKQWLSFSLWQGKANAEPTNHSLRVEIARYRHSDDFLRNESISRIKVKRLFKQPIGEQRVGATSYYEVLAYAEYRKHLNLMRDYMIREFDGQLLTLVQSKNDIKSPITLDYRGFANNDVIDQALKNYQDGKIDVNGFVKAIEDDYNKKLF